MTRQPIPPQVGQHATIDDGHGFERIGDGEGDVEALAALDATGFDETAETEALALRE